MKTKKPKRIKAWVNKYDWGIAVPRESIKEAREHAAAPDGGALRVAVPLVELRRGEVVVDVEALADAVARDLVDSGYDEEDAPTFLESVRAALKKVGVR